MPLVVEESRELNTSVEMVHCVPVPVMKKMKGLKKIKLAMGLSSRVSESTVLPESPIYFHSICGDNVRICHDGLVARRTQSFCKGIAFSHRPVKVNEKVCIRLLEVSNNWSGVVRFGFTNVNPANLANSLPRYVCPDLTNRPGFWAKALPEKLGAMGHIVHFSVNALGELVYGVNNKDEGVFLSGLDIKGGLWVVLDIYGNSTAVQFVNPNNLTITNSTPNNTVAISANVSNRQQQNNSTNAASTEEKLNSILSQIRITNPRIESVGQDRVTRRESNDFNLIRAVHHESSPDKLPLKYNHEYVYSEISFHLTKGANITYRDSTRTVAIRKFNTVDHGYVFTNRPIKVGEVFVVQILDEDSEYNGAMSFGVTSANPMTLNSSDLPAESDLLLDRPEYWAIQSHVASNARVGDEMKFSFLPDGRIKLSVNNGPSRTLMHVDSSLRLYAFFDVYGATTKMRMVGTAKVPTNLSELEDNEIRPMGTLNRLRESLAPSTSVVSEIDPVMYAEREVTRSQLLAPPQQVVHLPPSPLTPLYHRAATRVSQAPTNRQEGTDCSVCLELPVNSVLYSCGHMCMCYTCAMKLFSRSDGVCPICRAPIKDVIRTYTA